MECSVNTVKTRLFLARKTIRSEVEEQERKSGEKFYGVAGIPMLAFGRLIRSHMESLSISQIAATASLNAITGSISKLTSTEAVSTATAVKSQNTVTQGAKTAKKLSPKARIFAGVISVVAVVTVAALLVGLVTGVFGNTGWYSNRHLEDTLQDAPDTGDVEYDYNDLSTAVADIPNKKALDAIYILLEGYWITTTSDYPFIGFFTNDNGDHEVEYGLFQTSWGLRGVIVDGSATGTYEATLILYCPAIPADEMGIEVPESIQTITIDISGLCQSGDPTIRVKIENLFELDTDDGVKDNSVWFTYKPGGSTLEQAFDNWWADR